MTETTAGSTGQSRLRVIIERGIKRDPLERWATMHDLGSALAAWLLARGVQEDVTGTTLRACWPSVAHRTKYTRIRYEGMRFSSAAPGSGFSAR